MSERWNVIGTTQGVIALSISGLCLITLNSGEVIGQLTEFLGRLNSGTFSATFLLASLKAIEADTLRLENV